MRICIKVGTSTLTHSSGHLNIRQVEHLCKVLSDLKNAGNELLLVSSGAIGMGVGKLGLSGRPSDMATKQAAAAVGQCKLMYIYDKLFGEFNHNVAQVLLTAGDVQDPHRRANLRTTLSRLLELGVLPIINENDAVSTDEIGVNTTIGENDSLSAIVAGLVDAELLVLLSDINGLYTADPRKDPNATLIELVPELTPEIWALADGAGSALGSGGMTTKLKAAEIATAQGCDMIIANGKHPDALYGILDGDTIGTRFLRKETTA